MPTESQCLSGVPSLTSQKQEEFLDALRKSIDVFVNRMRVNSQRGRPVGNDSTLQTLFHTLHAMQPQLLQYFSELEHRRGMTIFLYYYEVVESTCHCSLVNYRGDSLKIYSRQIRMASRFLSSAFWFVPSIRLGCHG